MSNRKTRRKAGIEEKTTPRKPPERASEKISESEERHPTKTLEIPEATIIKSHCLRKKTRKGRGFSMFELKEIGLNPKKAIQIGLKIDPMRKTKYLQNVKKLKGFYRKE